MVWVEYLLHYLIVKPFFWFSLSGFFVNSSTITWLFLRLKKGELLNVGRRFDASKRRSTQFIQIFNFVITFFTTIGFVAAIFSKMAGQYSGSMAKLFLDVLVVWAVSGGVLVYYWLDEHKKRI